MGLFGRRPQFGQGIVATPEQEAESARVAAALRQPAAMPVDGAFGIGGQIIPQAPAPQRRGLGKIFGPNAGDKLFAIGGILQGDPRAAQEFLARGSIAQQRAAALADEQRKRSMKLEDYEAEKQIDAKYRAPQAEGERYSYFEDNVGNRWRQDKATGAVDPNPVWVDRSPKWYVQGDQAVQINNPFASGGMPAPSADAPDTLPAGFNFGGPTPPASGPFRP